MKQQNLILSEEFDETFTDKEIELIDNLITLSIKKGDLVSEEEVNKILLK
tara:strand:- start:942 stop:1091 length:150 start_codon:yes stop_codon:yes gene_type:complete